MGNKELHADALLKATEILIRLAQDGMRPIAVREFSKGGVGVVVYAHANGVYHLEKSGGVCTVDGYTLDQHTKIRDVAAAGISGYMKVADEMLKGKDLGTLLSKHSQLLQLKKAFDRSRGAADVLAAHLEKGRPPSLYPQSSTPTYRMNGIRARHFRDSNPDNDPKGPVAR